MKTPVAGGHFPASTPGRPAPAFFPGTLREVELLTADRGRLVGFYGPLLGAEELTREGDASLLGTTSGESADGAAPTLRLRLVGDARARPRPPGRVGLFHAAFLFPDRPALAAAARRLEALARRDHAVRLQGYSEHGVSEAVYGCDPDGNGVELALDRPFARWPRRPDGELAIFSWPLDLRELRREPPPAPDAAAPVLGHVHLSVSCLSRAEVLCADELGLKVVQRSYPGALFLAYGDYHHHVATNVWGGGGASAPSPGTAGLLSFTLRTPEGRAVRVPVTRLA